MAFARSTFLSICTLLLSSVQVLAATEYLKMSTTAAVNGVSVIECWQMESPFKQTYGNSTDYFLTTQLGNLSNASYTIFPAGTNYGTHAAPNVQYVILLSGRIIVTAPGTKDPAVVEGGMSGFLFAADSAEYSKTGHETLFETESLILQIPTQDGAIPSHTVLHDGPCQDAELAHVQSKSKIVAVQPISPQFWV